MENNEQLADTITKALGYTENGGKPDTSTTTAGKTGELKSIFQFTPDTWKNYAGEILGDPNTPITPDAETYVVHKKVSDWLEKGYQPKQIASMWNAGVGEPNAYSGKFSNGTSSVGVNAKYGVKFDVPSYANKVQKYVDEFSKQPTQSSGSPATPEGKQSSGKTNELVSHLLDIVKQHSPVKQQVASAKPGLVSIGQPSPSV